MPPHRLEAIRAVRPDVSKITPILLNGFRLQFKDAYLVYQPSTNILQIAAEYNVLSYGEGWTRHQVQPNLFHLKYSSWTGYFWAVNTATHTLVKVTGVAFGAPGGVQTPVPDVTVETVNNPAFPPEIILRFGDAYLDKRVIFAKPAIYASGNMLSDGAQWMVEQDGTRPWVYKVWRPSWQGFTWKVNLQREQAYRVTDPLDPCGTDVRLLADVYAFPKSITGSANDFDVYGCTWAAVARPAGMPYPATSPLAGVPSSEVVGKDVATATMPATATTVAIRDASNNALLAVTPNVVLYGDYDLRFTDAVAPKNVIFEVSQSGQVVYRSPSLPLAHGNDRREILLAGVEGNSTSTIPFPTAANTGVFTRIGNVELADIDVHGFARYAGSAAQWRDAPFGGVLDMFGALTQNFYPVNSGTDAYCYKLRVHPAAGADFYITDPLYKTRYVVLNTGKVVSARLNLAAANNCYFLTPLSVTPQPTDPPGAVAVFWSYPDLLARWNTGNKAALHSVTIELYHWAGAVGAPVGLMANDNMTSEVYLDNTHVNISFDELTISGGTNLITSPCLIANLSGGKVLTVDFTAQHTTGFLASYSLFARSNSGVTVWNQAGTYPAGAWAGDRPTLFYGRQPDAVPFTKTSHDFSAGQCAYVFDLSAWARTTDGYNRINWDWQQKFYYVQP